ncbi:SDR family NAD(P)-dependent oxidoreductase [Vibrio algarum]|uniref:SDR family NAD(P)-dependent oxidoreductase n=1 Tax=Vibrio algarum TaxID=3020714 RepID=A0ABT4YPD9_9VIBR|nr:SDR family NAD(P)-dependent oxidoreductase [Vibrio sp. KJ40-1]MDB1123410.1 SDR family NAD(P)-dependent oxidoreductase [Vibrio sp. KJ40-1]
MPLQVCLGDINVCKIVEKTNKAFPNISEWWCVDWKENMNSAMDESGMMKSVLITGANGGLGKECARQLALQNGIEKIYLGCRSEDKAIGAKKDLEASTGKNIFDIFLIDVSDLSSVHRAIESLKNPIDALVMNAGGWGGENPLALTDDGVTNVFAVNVLGHALLAEELLKRGMLTKVGLYVSSEAARGIPGMDERPELTTSSIDEFVSIADGTFFTERSDSTKPYAPVKYTGAMWLSSLARQYPSVRLITMSPGGTAGTEVTSSSSLIKTYIFKAVMSVMCLMGKMHRLETGAKRFVDGLLDESYQSGVFYASVEGITGPVGDQTEIFSDLGDETYQDNARAAIRQFLS